MSRSRRNITSAQLILARRADLHQRPNTFAQTIPSPDAFSLQSRGGPYNLGTNPSAQ